MITEGRAHLQYGDVPGEALHRLVQLAPLQPLLHRRVVDVLVKRHRCAGRKQIRVNRCGQFFFFICEAAEGRRDATEAPGLVVTARKRIAAEALALPVNISQTPSAAEGSTEALGLWRRIPPWLQCV